MSSGQKKKSYEDALRKQYEDACHGLSSDTDNDEDGVSKLIKFVTEDSDDSSPEDINDHGLEDDVVLSDTAHSDDEMPVVLHTKKFAFAIRDGQECPQIECVDRATGSPIASLKALSMFARRLKMVQSADDVYRTVTPNVCYAIYVLQEVAHSQMYRKLLTDMSALMRDGVEVSDVDYKGFSMRIPVDDDDFILDTSKVLRVGRAHLTMPILFYNSPTGVVLLRHKNNCATMKKVPASEHAAEIKLFMLSNRSLLSGNDDDHKPVACPKTHWYDHILKSSNEKTSVSSSGVVWKKLFRNVFGNVLEDAPKSPLAVYLTDLIIRTMSSQKKPDVFRRASTLQKEKGLRTVAPSTVKKQSALAFGAISRDVSSVARSIVASASPSNVRSDNLTPLRSPDLSSAVRHATVANPPPVAMSPELHIDVPADQLSVDPSSKAQSSSVVTEAQPVVSTTSNRVECGDHMELSSHVDRSPGSPGCVAITPTRQSVVPDAPKKSVKRKGADPDDEITCVKKLCFDGGAGTFVLHFRQAPFVSYRMFDKYNVIGVDWDASGKHTVTMTGTFRDFIGATVAFKSLPIVVLGWSFKMDN